MYSQMIIVKPTMVSTSLIISEDVFPRLHSLFVNNDCQFGLSFPAYSFNKHGSLGNIVEVLCENKDALAALDLTSVFKNTEDIKVMSNINETNDYVLFRRIREKNRFDKYIERFRKRGNEAPGNMKAHIQHHNKNIFSHAYIMVRSTSTGQKYNLFIAPTEEKTAKFNSFGLVMK